MQMIRFEHIEFLYGLALVPLLIIIFLVAMRWKRKAFVRFGDRTVFGRLMPDYSKSKPVARFILLLLAYCFLIVGISNPQIGSKLEEVERKGIDLIIALDVSNSMLAEDIKPDRLTRARQAISNLIDGLSGDRIGMIVFAGKAYMQLPITTDYAAAKLFLSTIDTKVVPTQGTAIGDAIELAINSFQENDHSKAIIIITDGENHEGNALRQAGLAAEKGINIYTVGMGLPEGAPIPVYNNYNKRVGYKKDNQGNTVITKLDEDMLQQIASTGNGIFVMANNTQVGLNKIFDKINAMEKTEFESKVFSDYEDRFQYFIGLAVILLLLETLIPEKKSKWIRRFNVFGR